MGSNLGFEINILCTLQAELTSRCSELDRLKEENKRLQESLTTQLSHSKGMQNEVHTLVAIHCIEIIVFTVC